MDPSGVDRAVFRFKKMMPEYVFDSVKLEGNPFTFPEVKTLLDGVTVGGHRLSDQQQVLHQKRACDALLRLLESREFNPLNVDQWIALNTLVAEGEALYTGAFRDGPVSIAGTAFCPPEASGLMAVFVDESRKIERIQNPVERAYVYSAWAAINQFFWDGNKRTGRLFMNGVLMSAGFDALSIPASIQLAYNQACMRLYEDNDATDLFVLMMNRHMEITRTNSPSSLVPVYQKNDPVHQATHGLVFSGSLPNLAISKCYHAMVFMAQLNNWERDTDGYFTITIAELDRITGGSCHKWEEYQKLIEKLRDVTIDWASFIRPGRHDTLDGHTVERMPVLSDVHGLENLKTKKVNALKYRFPDAILDHFIQTKDWFGQVDPVVLFKFRNHAGFNAYLYACMVATGESSTNEFWSSSYTKDEWRCMLGIEDGKYSDANFTNVLMPRLAKQICEKTEGTRKPMMVEFRKTKDKRFQMRVVVLDKKPRFCPASGSECV